MIPSLSTFELITQCNENRIGQDARKVRNVLLNWRYRSSGIGYPRNTCDAMRVLKIAEVLQSEASLANYMRKRSSTRRYSTILAISLRLTKGQRSLKASDETVYEIRWVQISAPWDRLFLVFRDCYFRTRRSLDSLANNTSDSIGSRRSISAVSRGHCISSRSNKRHDDLTLPHPSLILPFHLQPHPSNGPFSLQKKRAFQSLKSG